jgi:hypothetical protein
VPWNLVDGSVGHVAVILHVDALIIAVDTERLAPDLRVVVEPDCIVIIFAFEQ